MSNYVTWLEKKDKISSPRIITQLMYLAYS